MKAIVVRQPWATLIALGVKTIETRPSPPNGPMRPDGVHGLPGCSLERGERIAIVAGAAWPDPKWMVGDWMVGGWTTTGNHAEDEDGECTCPDPEDGECTCPDPEDGVWSDECRALNDWNLSLLHDERAHGLSFVAPLPLGAVVCTVTVDDALPIMDYNPTSGRDNPPIPSLDLTGHTLAHWWHHDGGFTLVTDQLPLGDFTPDRWGWMLSDPQPITKRCVECDGTGGYWGPCSCRGSGRVPSDPIPCKGRQGVFKLPPEITEQLS